MFDYTLVFSGVLIVILTGCQCTSNNHSLVQECSDSRREWHPCPSQCPMTCDNIYHTDDNPICPSAYDQRRTCEPACVCKPGYIPAFSVNAHNAPCVKPLDCFAMKTDINMTGKRECLKHQHLPASFNNVYMCGEDTFCCPDSAGTPMCCAIKCPWPQYKCESRCCFNASYWILVLFFIGFTLGAAGLIGCVIYDPVYDDTNVSSENIIDKSFQRLQTVFNDKKQERTPSLKGCKTPMEQQIPSRSYSDIQSKTYSGIESKTCMDNQSNTCADTKSSTPRSIVVESCASQQLASTDVIGVGDEGSMPEDDQPTTVLIYSQVVYESSSSPSESARFLYPLQGEQAQPPQPGFMI